MACARLRACCVAHLFLGLIHLMSLPPYLARLTLVGSCLVALHAAQEKGPTQAPSSRPLAPPFQGRRLASHELRVGPAAKGASVVYHKASFWVKLDGTTQEVPSAHLSSDLKGPLQEEELEDLLRQGWLELTRAGGEGYRLAYLPGALREQAHGAALLRPAGGQSTEGLRAGARWLHNTHCFYHRGEAYYAAEESAGKAGQPSHSTFCWNEGINYPAIDPSLFSSDTEASSAPLQRQLTTSYFTQHTRLARTFAPGHWMVCSRDRLTLVTYLASRLPQEEEGSSLIRALYDALLLGGSLLRKDLFPQADNYPAFKEQAAGYLLPTYEGSLAEGIPGLRLLYSHVVCCTYFTLQHKRYLSFEACAKEIYARMIYGFPVIALFLSGYDGQGKKGKWQAMNILGIQVREDQEDQHVAFKSFFVLNTHLVEARGGRTPDTPIGELTYKAMASNMYHQGAFDLIVFPTGASSSLGEAAVSALKERLVVLPAQEAQREQEEHSCALTPWEEHERLAEQESYDQRLMQTSTQQRRGASGRCTCALL